MTRLRGTSSSRLRRMDTSARAARTLSVMLGGPGEGVSLKMSGL